MKQTLRKSKSWVRVNFFARLSEIAMFFGIRSIPNALVVFNLSWLYVGNKKAFKLFDC